MTRYGIVGRPIIFLAVASLSACAYTLERDAELIPTNQIATGVGEMHARFIAHGIGVGEAMLTMPDGDTMTGFYHIQRGLMNGFGDIIVAALTSQGRDAMISAIGGYQVVSAGTATVNSPTGKSANCEFYNNNLSGHGFGACELPGGALYQLKY